MAAEWGFVMDCKGTLVPTTDLLIGASAFGLDHEW